MQHFTVPKLPILWLWDATCACVLTVHSKIVYACYIVLETSVIRRVFLQPNIEFGSYVYKAV